MSGPVVTRNLQPYSNDYAQRGIYAPQASIYRSVATIFPAASRAYIMRFVPSRPMVITNIVFRVTTAASNADAFSVGLYTAGLVRLVTSGAITTATVGSGLNATAGPREVTVTATPLTPGVVYYAGFSYGTIGATAATFQMADYGLGSGGELMGTAVPAIEVAFRASNHPLPDPFGAISLAAQSVPLLAIRES